MPFVCSFGRGKWAGGFVEEVLGAAKGGKGRGQVRSGRTSDLISEKSRFVREGREERRKKLF